MKLKSALALGALFVSGSAWSDVVSGFDTDAEGWRTANVDLNALSVTYQAPSWSSGRIEATEFASGLFLLAAPSPYLGDLSGYVGGSVSFRLADASADGEVYPALILQSGNRFLHYDAPPPGTGLTAFTVPLTASAWKFGALAPGDLAPTDAQFRDTLANVTGFWINADWTSGTRDVVALDDVVLASPVPEPGTLGALGLGLVASGRRRVRGQRSRRNE